jgi:hypothetical protein
MSASKPFDDASLRCQSSVKTGAISSLRDQSGRDLLMDLTAAGVKTA